MELLEREETISALGPRELNTIANYAMVKTRVESDIKSMAGGGGTSSSMQSLSRKFSLSATNNNERAFLIKSKRMSALKYRINAEQLVILSDTKLKGSLNNLKQIPPSVAADEEMGIVNVMKSCSDNSKEGSTESVNSDLNGLNSKPKKSKKSSYLQAFSNSSLDRKKSNAQTSVVPSQPVLKLARESDLEWFKQLRRANHSNVAKFMSICNRKNVVMFFYEFSERGVLEDVLLQNRG